MIIIFTTCIFFIILISIGYEYGKRREASKWINAAKDTNIRHYGGNFYRVFESRVFESLENHSHEEAMNEIHAALALKKAVYKRHS